MFKILGITGDVTKCECCGRDDLKRTVILGILDADRNVVDVTHYGSNCAAKATKFRSTGKGIESLAEQAQREADRAASQRIVEVNVNDVFPDLLWVVESIGQNGGSVDRLCFAKGTRNAIREYPNRIIEVRTAR
jgi:hypothetical protein